MLLFHAELVAARHGCSLCCGTCFVTALSQVLSESVLFACRACHAPLGLLGFTSKP